MRDLEGTEGRRPYAAPALTMHGDVREVTQAVNGGGNVDGKAKGNKVFRTG
jgi:hypothetical protein